MVLLPSLLQAARQERGDGSREDADEQPHGRGDVQAEAVNQGEYLIPRLGRDQLKAAIEGPAKVGGGEISYRLLQHLLNEVGDEDDRRVSSRAGPCA